MSLARAASAVQQAVLASVRIAPAATSTSGTTPAVFSRFFAGGYLDRNSVTERILAQVKHFEKVDPNKVSTSSSFHDLGLDSLDTVEIVMAMEEEFAIEIPDEDADKIHSVEDAVDYFANHPHAQ